MTLEQAHALWRDTRSPALGDDEVLRRVARAARQFRWHILVRDLSELFATILLAGVFMYNAFQPGAPRATFLAATGLAVFPMLFLGMHRLLNRESKMPSATSREHVESALREVQNQQWLLGRVQWWYLLPLGLGAAVYFAGHSMTISNGSPIAKAVALVLAAATSVVVGIFIWRLNQHVVRERLKPHADYLSRLADSLQENEAG